MATALSDDSRRALCREVERSFETRQVPWLARLIELPSHTLAREDVEAAATFIDGMAEELGLSRRLCPDPEGGFASHRVYGSPGLSESGRALALVGHCDTVFPRSQQFLHFQRDAPDSPSGGDIIRGPGTLDMKSGLSVILFGLDALRKGLPDHYSRLPFRFICNTDEEVGSPTSRTIYAELAPHTSAALVFEGGREGDCIITSRKGAATFECIVHGKEAHAGNHHREGVNAILALAHLIPRIEALTDYDRGTLLNVGVIEGGTAKNTVPGNARCVIDARAATEAEALRVADALRAIAADPFGALDPAAKKRLSAARVELRGGFRRMPMEAMAPSRALLTEYARHAAAVGLGTEEAPLQGGGSDANLLAALGVPVIDGLGPYGRHFHSVEEFSSLSSLLRKTQALACFLAARAN